MGEGQWSTPGINHTVFGKSANFTRQGGQCYVTGYFAGFVNDGPRWKLGGILTASFSYGVCGLEFGGPLYGIQLVWACDFLG
ncbi:hypothetical protein U1Q18_009916 [Sarracenia purpurea var. burkii]